MGLYQTGDVVLAPILYSTEEGSKLRPVIILREVSPCNYLVIECNSLKPKHHHRKGIIVRSTDTEFYQTGFKEDTFINFESKAILLQKYLKRKIGTYIFIDEIPSY